MKKLPLILLPFLAYPAFATHERAGEITYIHLSGNTYQISITTYTKGSPPSTGADRCSLMIYFGDGDSALVCRSNGPSGVDDPWGASCNNNPNCQSARMGEMFGPKALDIKKNIYTTTHTYPGAGMYVIYMTDPNRNEGIVNMDEYTDFAFSIQDTLVINPFLGPNNSPVLVNPPIDKACIGKIFIHNPGAVDSIDGDSLSYKLGVCFQDKDTPVGGFFIPAGVSLNPVTGDFIWNSPALLGPEYKLCYEYNFAIDIQEWRKAAGTYYLVGTIRRDMQITVCDCDNDPPVISDVNDTCILANTNLTFTVTATDPGNNWIKTFDATGGSFNTTPSATFSSDAPVQSPSTGIFSWTPTCNQVRKFPYLVTLKATDDGAPDDPPVPLSDYETFFITVIAPAPKNLTAVPRCTNIELTWDAALCNPSGNGLVGYRMYRKMGCDDSIPGYCETGMPSTWGYTLIATVSKPATSFTDNNGGNGLVHGNLYSYRVAAYYLDGAESYISDPVCRQLVRDVPIITNVDVISTGTNGSIHVKWIKPIADSANYDTVYVHPGHPYKYELYRAAGITNPAAPSVISFSSPFFATLNTDSFLDSGPGFNTQGFPYTYRVELVSSSDTITCPAQNASSVFISCNPSDNKINLTWNEKTPWTNYRYDVYRFNSLTWDSIGTTALQTFTDSGLVNGANYCYKVKSIGKYPDLSIPAPLINWSQELCCSPEDKTPPCPNLLAVDSNCVHSYNHLTWTNPNNSCSDDAIYYIIYHTSVKDNEFEVFDTIYDINTTFFLDDSLKSIAGCYAVTSVDSFGNESAFSNIVCVDNCPYYQLPNVFTPNSDGSNDFFTPLHPYKYVESIDIKIYNRWGVEVFRTMDTEILWDGRNAETKMLCSDGVYYYVCIVNDIRLIGIVPHALTGNVHLLGGK